MNKKIYVVPVPNRSVQGRGEYSIIGDNGRVMPTNRQWAKGVRIPLKFHVDKDNPNTLKTGLEKRISNPFYQMEFSDLNEDQKPGGHWLDHYDELSEMETISLQNYYEILDNVPEGTYSPLVALPIMNNLSAGSEAFTAQASKLESFRCFLEEGVNIFDTSTGNGRLSIQVVENHPSVAPSKEKVNPDVHLFYISEKDQDVKEANASRRRFQRTVGKLNKLVESASPFVQYQLAVALDVVRGDAPPQTVEQAISDYVWEEKRTSMGSRDERNDRFNRYYKMLEEEPDRLYVHYLIQSALHERIIDGNGRSHEYIWRSQRGNDSLYKLGRNIPRIVNTILMDMKRYDPEVEEDNAYAMLVEELKKAGIQLR